MRDKVFSGYGSVIKKYRSRAGFSQADLAELLSVSRNTVINWEAEKSQPDMFYLRRLCEELTIPLHELFHMPGKTNYTLEERQLVNVFRELSSFGKKAIHRQMIALRDTETDEREAEIKNKCICFAEHPDALAAGSGIPFTGTPPKLRIMYRTPANTGADAIARVSGRSMEPYYHDGDHVYIRYTDCCEPGDIVACSTADGGVIKRVNDKRKLVSLNPDYPFGDKNDDDHVTVIGKVTGIVQEKDTPSDEDAALYAELFAPEIRRFKQEHGIEDS